MAGLIYPPLPLLLILSLSSYVHCQSSEEAKSKEEQEETVTTAGFLMYRLANASDPESVQYLLLKSADDDLWNPPMTKVEGTESQLLAAIRVAQQDTGYAANFDYLGFTGSQDQVYFQFEKDEVLNRVHLWPARVMNFGKSVQLSTKHTEHAWMDYQEANELINGQYRTGLSLGDAKIRAGLVNDIASYYKNAQNPVTNRQPVLVEFEP